MAQGMPRRHFFDNGFPVSHGTLIAGSHVLLAISRQSLRNSRNRLATSLLRLADSAGCVAQSRALKGSGDIALRDSRDNFNYGNAVRSAGERVPAGVGREPSELPACEEPDRP